MALVTTKDMFAKALNADYAVGAFNVNNILTLLYIWITAKTLTSVKNALMTDSPPL